MTGWKLLRHLLALASLAAQATLAQASVAPARALDPLPSRQILVMLKVTPQHLHPGSAYAGNLGGRYGDSSSVSAGHRTADNIARKNSFTIVDSWPMPLLGVDCYVMRISPGISIEAAVAQVSRDPRVAWSEPMQVYQAQGGKGGIASDPLLPIEPAAVGWRLVDLHKVATGRGVIVAIIDSKVDVDHPDLTGHFIANENFLATAAAQPELHGTAVAGIIGATAGNGIGIAGIAPDARLMALRACWQVRGEEVHRHCARASGSPAPCNMRSITGRMSST